MGKTAPLLGHGHAHGPAHETASLFDAVSCACQQCTSLRTGRHRSMSGSLLKRNSDWGGHDHDPSEHIGDSGSTETTWNIVNLVIGGGVLSMPYVCKLSGWLGIVIIAATAAIFAFNAIVVGAILRQQHDWFEHHDVPKESRDYVLLGKLAFGNTGAWLTATISVLENWSAAICYLIFVGNNVHIVTGLSISLGIVMSGALSLVMLYMPLRLLSYFGVVGMFCAAGAVGTLVAQGMLSDLPSSRVNFDLGGAGTAGGVAFFCFAGHACLPNVYWSMQHPKEDYAKACASAYTTVFAFYGATAAIGYYFFGDSLTNSFTESLKLQNLLIPAIAAILVKIQVAVPPNLAPPLFVIETFLGLGSEVAKFMSRCVIVGMSIVVAVFCQGALTQLVAVSGYMTTGYDSLIFPSFVAFRLGTGTSLRVLHGLIGILGFWVCIAGTYVSLANL